MIDVDDISRGVWRIDGNLQSALEDHRRGDKAGLFQKIASYLTSSRWPVVQASSFIQNGVVIPDAGWNLVVSFLMLAQEFARVTRLVRDMFCIETLQLQLCDSVGMFNVRVVFDQRALEFHFNPQVVTNAGIDFVRLRFVAILPMLAHVFRYRRGNGSFEVGMLDSGSNAEASFCSNSSGAVLIPDPIFLETASYHEIRHSFASKARNYHNRDGRALWRGSTTGVRPTARWRTLPRAILCEIGAQNADFFDCGLTHVVQCASPEEANEISHSDLVMPTITSRDFDKYRFHIDIDGNSNSWPGLFVKLLSGGTVFKVASPEGYQQWYYDRLVAWHHYIPINSEMGDLVEKVSWASRNLHRAERIGMAGRALAQQMTLANELDYAVSVIEKALK